MSANTQTTDAEPLPLTTATLGEFLRGRRARLRPDPTQDHRRRTPGLRREEVASKAGVSVTWYTWLEQGRGGPPSNEVLERLARALELDTAGREMMFLLAQQRPPPPRRTASPTAVSPTVQRVLNAMVGCAAMVKTPTWDVVAWNAAAAALMGGDANSPPAERNSLRRLFLDPRAQQTLPDWEDNARMMLAVFRMDVARMGGSPEASALVADLAARSPAFRRLWAESDDPVSHGAAVKRFEHPGIGPFALEVTAFQLDGEGLTMIVFTPATAADQRAFEALLTRQVAAA